VRWKALICAVRGHRWTAPPEVHEAYPLFECARCGRRQEFAPGTRSAGFGSRLDAETGADKAFGPYRRR
jgi:hypothetical protein